MVKCRLPILIQDRSQGGTYAELTQHYDVVEPFFADGPVTRRLAVIDFDPATGALLEPVKLVPPAKGNSLYRYEVPTEGDVLTSREFLALNAFAVVIRTMRLYEDEKVLGRRITWGFDGPAAAHPAPRGPLSQRLLRARDAEPPVLRLRRRRHRRLPRPLA